MQPSLLINITKKDEKDETIFVCFILLSYLVVFAE